jgi:hypothetical protein
VPTEPVATTRRFDRASFLATAQSIGLVTNVLIPMAVLAVAWGWDSGRLGRLFEPSMLPDTARVVGVALAAASVFELAALWFVRRVMLSRVLRVEGHAQRGSLFSIIVVVYAIAATPAIYGAVVALLGGPLWASTVCVAVSLLCFRMFRLRESDFARRSF